MGSTSRRVDVIVVNWNSGDMLLRLLESLENIKDKTYINKFIVVDNNSSDNSMKILNGKWSFEVEIIENKKNYGFAKACNIGAQKAISDYVLFLNPDTWIYEGALRESIHYLDRSENEHYAACGIQLVNDRNIPNRSCARIPNFRNFLFSGLGLDIILPRVFPGILLREWEHSESKDIGHVIGAFYLVRRSIFERFDGFDERYFLYYEDLDFSTTLARNGYKIAYLARVRAVHVGGGCSQKIKAKRLSYSYISKIKYIMKHFSTIKALILILVFFSFEPFLRFCFYILQFSIKDAFASLFGYFRFLITLAVSPFKGLNHG